MHEKSETEEKLTKDMKDLYTENHKTLLREIEEIQVPYFGMYNAHPCFWPKLSEKIIFILIF